MIRHPDRRLFSAEEAARPVFVISALQAGRLGYSEWAVRVPDGDTVPVPPDPRHPPNCPEVRR